MYRARVRVRVRGCLSAFSARRYKIICNPRVTNRRSPQEGDKPSPFCSAFYITGGDILSCGVVSKRILVSYVQYVTRIYHDTIRR